jgi:hypothetical protein
MPNPKPKTPSPEPRTTNHDDKIESDYLTVSIKSNSDIFPFCDSLNVWSFLIMSHQCSMLNN